MNKYRLKRVKCLKKNFSSFTQASFLGKSPFNTTGKQEYWLIFGYFVWLFIYSCMKGSVQNCNLQVYLLYMELITCKLYEDQVLHLRIHILIYVFISKSQICLHKLSVLFSLSFKLLHSKTAAFFRTFQFTWKIPWLLKPYCFLRVIWLYCGTWNNQRM